MKSITRLMINEWKMKKIDWLGYEVQRKNDFQYHHIVKREHGGLETIDNGAILLPVDHQYIHIIEYKDLEMYIYINTILKIINEQRHMPSRSQLLAIDSILQQFEREHCSDRNSKGKILIKEEYTKRLVKKI